MRIAARMSTIGTESAFEVSARARALEAEGRSIIHLQIGEPDFDTPANVREAAKARARRRARRTTRRSPGSRALREAIAADASARKGFAVEPGQVFVTVGGKGVMLYAILGLVDPGDEVLVPGSRLPDLRIADPLRRREPDPGPDPDGQRLPARRRRAGLARHAADAGARSSTRRPTRPAGC